MLSFCLAKELEKHARFNAKQIQSLAHNMKKLDKQVIWKLSNAATQSTNADIARHALNTPLPRKPFLQVMMPDVASPNAILNTARCHSTMLRIGKEMRYASRFLRDQPKIVRDAVSNTNLYQHYAAPTHVPSMDFIPALKSYLSSDVAEPLGHTLNLAANSINSFTGIKGIDQMTALPKSYLQSVRQHRHLWLSKNR